MFVRVSGAFGGSPLPVLERKESIKSRERLGTQTVDKGVYLGKTLFLEMILELNRGRQGS
jgi:hypothetical protein